MAKLSHYPDGGQMQDADEHLVTRTNQDGSKSSVNLLGSAIKAGGAEGVAATTVYGGAPGEAGFPFGVPKTLPAGFSAMPDHETPSSENFANVQFSDGSIMAIYPKAYYRIGHLDNATYATHGLNSVDVKYANDFINTADANNQGYALHPVFMNAGEEQDFVARDKYFCSKNPWGTGFVASSIKNALALSFSLEHNPVSELTACASNVYHEAFNAVHARDGVDGNINPDSQFFVESRQLDAWSAICTRAHDQASTNTTHCAWYDATGVNSFPKGCNNSLSDVNDSSVLYTSDGYSSCGKTGSGLPFNKTTDNGQSCGVADVNGLMWRVSIGLTRDFENQDFWTLKSSSDITKLKPGQNIADAGDPLDAWGDAAHLATLYDASPADYITHASAWTRFGNGTNQVLSSDLTGNGYQLTGVGLPKDGTGVFSSGSNDYGRDGIYKYHRALLCVLSGGDWSNGALAGAWTAYLYGARTGSSGSVGFRAACYL